MKLLRDVPIQHKLVIITMVTSDVALLLACLAFVVYELVAFRGAMVSELLSTAEMLADNTSAALAFDDPSAAAQTLNSLSAHSNIVGAAIYDSHGRVFAEYRRAPSTASSATFTVPAVQPDGYRFDRDRLVLFHTINLTGERAGTVYIQSDLGERARLRRYALIVVLVMVGASVVTFFLARQLQRAISGPISHLAGVVGVVAKQNDYSVRATKQGEDELGQLIDGFNHMLNQIQASTAELQKEIAERKQAQTEVERIHRELLVASRQAGMAEIATNVLHNVGNVLNSVNVSANLVANHVQNSKISGLARVVALLREHAHDLGTFITSDVRGKHLPGHLANLSEHLQAEQAVTVKELDSLRANIDHIKEIVTMQQSYAKVGGVNEIVNVVDLVEDSLRMNDGALARHRVKVVRDFLEEALVNLDKHKVLQILVNLVRNAKYACEESGRADRQITLRVLTVDTRVRISVADNGVGIAPQNLNRIFNHGFTTRAAGHGFGLHSGALAAQELGGSLTARSDGVGCGATFTLELPLHVGRLEPVHA